MHRFTLALLAFTLASPAFAQSEIRGDWIACPNVLKTAGLCVDGEAIFYIIAPVAKSVLARDATCWQGGYQATIDDGAGNQIPNPEACKAFAVRRIYELWKSWHGTKTARETAEAAAQAAYAAAHGELGDVEPED